MTRVAPRSAVAGLEGTITGRHRLTDVERAERKMTGGELQRLIVGDLTNPGLAALLGWEWLHVVPGIRSKGRWWTATTGSLSRWPDLTLVRERDRRLIFAEVKRELEEPTDGQATVLDVLRALTTPATSQCVPEQRCADCGPRVEVHVWRPSDLRDPIETSRIFEVLR